MTSKAKLSLQIEGLDPLIKSLAQFKRKSTATRIMKASVNKAATVLLQGARRNAPKETGLMKKALTKKMIGKGMSVSAIIGVDATVEGTGPDGGKRVPNKYVHLVEYGFLNTATGKHVPGSRFLAKTSEDLGPKASQRFAEVVGQKIEKELAKAKAKGKGKK